MEIQIQRAKLNLNIRVHLNPLQISTKTSKISQIARSVDSRSLMQQAKAKRIYFHKAKVFKTSKSRQAIIETLKSSHNKSIVQNQQGDQFNRSSERPFKCEYPECRLQFQTKGHLKTHQLNHQEVKPFKCTICGVSYS